MKIAASKLVPSPFVFANNLAEPLLDCNESTWSHLNFKFCTCFEQGVP